MGTKIRRSYDQIAVMRRDQDGYLLNGGHRGTAFRVMAAVVKLSCTPSSTWTPCFQLPSAARVPRQRVVRVQGKKGTIKIAANEVL